MENNIPYFDEMNKRNTRIIYKSQTNAVDYAYEGIIHIKINSTLKPVYVIEEYNIIIIQFYKIIITNHIYR